MLDAAVERRLAAEGADAVRRLAARDPALWTAYPEQQAAVAARLGWLAAPEALSRRSDELAAFASEARAAGFTRVVLIGMGGSSLAAEVVFRTFGLRAGYPGLVVLDSTDPAAILRLEATGDLGRTLFLVASKSGTTLETGALLAHFWSRTGGRGEQFAAITDPATPLASLARERRFRRLFESAPDVGGRYSALSYFGLVPAAVVGVDVASLLERACRMAKACLLPAAENAAAGLAALLAEAWRAGRDKLTLVMAPAFASLGAWVEQLVAESTGKDGKGLVPIVDEPLALPDAYGSDRLFVAVQDGRSPDPAGARALAALERAGHPVGRIVVGEPLELGAEFFRWEVATALAGAWMGLNPFDEPNVAESKANTERVLGELAEGASPEPAVADPSPLAEALARWVALIRPGDYVALLAYVEPSAEHALLVSRMRRALRDALGVATTAGFGPRFLHSTGQLHKGGGGGGVFLQIETDDAVDLPVPGGGYSFGQLKLAQALGDYRALVGRGRRVLRVRVEELTRIADALDAALGARARHG